MLLRGSLTVPSVVLIVTAGYLATGLSTPFAKLRMLATATTRLTNSVGRGQALTRSTPATWAPTAPSTSATTLLARPALTASLALTATRLLAFDASLARTTATARRIGNAIPDVIADVGISRRHPTGIRSPPGLEAITLGAVGVTAAAVTAFVPTAIPATTVAPTPFTAMSLTFRATFVPAL